MTLNQSIDLAPQLWEWYEHWYYVGSWWLKYSCVNLTTKKARRCPNASPWCLRPSLGVNLVFYGKVCDYLIPFLYSMKRANRRPISYAVSVCLLFHLYLRLQILFFHKRLFVLFCFFQICRTKKWCVLNF